MTRAIKAHKVYQQIDGSLLLMFAGLFVVVAAAEKMLLTRWSSDHALDARFRRLMAELKERPPPLAGADATCNA